MCIFIKIRAYNEDPYVYIKIYVYILRFLHFRHKLKRHRWTDYRAFKRRPKMEANRTNSLPNEEAISSLGRRVYRAMTEEVRCERSRVSGGNSSNVEEELSRNFQILRLGAHCIATSLVQSTSKLW